MHRSLFLIGAVATFYFSTITAAVDSLNDDVHGYNLSLPLGEILNDTMHRYFQEEEKRLATIRKYLEDQSKEHEKATQKCPIKDDKEIEKEAEDKKYFRPSEMKLCRGEITLPASIQKTLKCRYVDRGDPFLKIAPFKEEEAFLDPRIVLYHSVIYDEEIETLKRLAEPWLEIAYTVDSATGRKYASEERIAKSAWIEDETSTHMQHLNRRVEHLTGLTIDSAEEFQVVYYEIGGLYLTHHDFFKDTKYFEVNNGNRISTVLFYMNDVAEGGATIFPALNVTIWPRKGTALFWHNLKHTGVGDRLTIHGACPVFSGTKWIVSKWLHEKGQEFHKPCNLLEN